MIAIAEVLARKSDSVYMNWCAARIRITDFSFPGGRRFRFADPNGNELTV